MKKLFTKIAKDSMLLRKLIRKSAYYYRLVRYKLRGFGKSIDDRLIVLSSFTGEKYADSPRAIYEYMINSGEFDDYKFVWCFTEPDKYSFLLENKNTRIVKQASKEFEVVFATAKYWVCNHRVSLHRFPRKNQVFIQTWHGTPLKRLGFDIEKSNNENYTLDEQNKQYLIDAKKFSYLLSPSAFASEKFISAFALERLGKTDIIIEQGYPRNDELFSFDDNKVSSIKDALGVPHDKRVILYAPTWRDNQHTANEGYTYKTEVDFDRLKNELGDGYIILFRAHYFISNSFDFEKYSGFVYDVSKLDDINELYIIADMLITDYSSVFFDYAILRRPIIYYMYDFDLYKNEMRGFYIDIDELPGAIVKDEDGLIEEIKAADGFEYGEKYKRFNEKFNYLDDGRASERVVNMTIKQGN
ncbi:MAG: CDP-glycerol glycerophosphotransferase family protein [Eubacterium sp.]|nr:CDP-glycerol glycerophosphotransferase family protein [Eubacterium sp.]